MGKGAKANHLAYLGDGVIGAGANIGAGTIFCNYDGFRKHTTTIGEGAFIGSDSQIVAPVTVGANAYVGHGDDGDAGRARRCARHRAGAAGEQGRLRDEAARAPQGGRSQEVVSRVKVRGACGNRVA